MRLDVGRIALHATVLLALLAVCATFFALARWVDGTYFLPFDKKPSIWVQDLESEPADRLFGFVNDVGDLQWIAAALIALFGLLVVRGRLFEAAVVLGAGAMRYAQLGVREIVDRPFSWDEPPVPVRVFPNEDSFPSGTFMGEVLAYGLIFAFIPRIVPWQPIVWIVRMFCVFIIVVGGPARLYTGAHWTSDLIGSLLLASMYLIPALWLDNVLRERTRGESPGVLTRSRFRPLAVDDAMPEPVQNAPRP
ncbi:MAG: phosphatase PAP2 family protein [Dehalococcoidia bacterium]